MRKQLELRAWIGKTEPWATDKDCLMFYQGDLYKDERQYLQSFLRRCGTFSYSHKEHDSYNGDSYILMEWTGGRDITGRKVFDRDILEHAKTGLRFKVEWSERSFSFRLRCLNNGEKLSNSIQPFNTLLVIGNEFENPELLTVQQP